MHPRGYWSIVPSMSVRIAVLGAICLGGLAAVVWFVTAGSGESNTGKASKPGAVSTSRTPTLGSRSVESPGGARPLVVGVGGTVTGTRPRPQLRVSGTANSFESEVRDPAWADAKEKTVRARLTTLLSGYDGVRVPKLECRVARCSLLVVGSNSKTLQQFVGALQDERGFYKRAKQFTMHDYRPAKNANDESSVGVMLEYER